MIYVGIVFLLPVITNYECIKTKKKKKIITNDVITISLFII